MLVLTWQWFVLVRLLVWLSKSVTKNKTETNPDPGRKSYCDLLFSCVSLWRRLRALKCEKQKGNKQEAVYYKHLCLLYHSWFLGLCFLLCSHWASSPSFTQTLLPLLSVFCICNPSAALSPGLRQDKQHLGSMSVQYFTTGGRMFYSLCRTPAVTHS